MGQRLWWGALAGATAGLALLACALGLAGLGRVGCLRPYLVLTATPLSPAPHGAPITLTALALGTALHETVAIMLGVLGAWAVTPRARSLTAATWLVGGGLSMAALDAAVVAVRTPDLPPLADTLRSVEYLAFGLVAAAWALARQPPATPVQPSAIPCGPPGPRGARAAGPAAARRIEGQQDSARSERAILQVVVAPHCFGCARAHVLAAAAATRYPALEVRVVDLAQPDVIAPPGLVAVPAYILNGRIIFTGNPTPDALDRALCGTRTGAPPEQEHT